MIALCGDIVFDGTVLFFYRALIAFLLLLLVISLVCSLFSFRAMIGSEGKLLNGIYSFLDSRNNISSQATKYMYYPFIHKSFSTNPAEYWKSIAPNKKSADEKVLSSQVANQIVDLSGVAYRKSALFNIAIKLEFIIFGTCDIGAFIILIIKCFEHF